MSNNAEIENDSSSSEEEEDSDSSSEMDESSEYVPAEQDDNEDEEEEEEEMITEMPQTQEVEMDEEEEEEDDVSVEPEEEEEEESTSEEEEVVVPAAPAPVPDPPRVTKKRKRKTPPPVAKDVTASQTGEAVDERAKKPRKKRSPKRAKGAATAPAKLIPTTPTTVVGTGMGEMTEGGTFGTGPEAMAEAKKVRAKRLKSCRSRISRMAKNALFKDTPDLYKLVMERMAEELQAISKFMIVMAIQACLKDTSAADWKGENVARVQRPFTLFGVPSGLEAPPGAAGGDQLITGAAARNLFFGPKVSTSSKNALLDLSPIMVREWVRHLTKGMSASEVPHMSLAVLSSMAGNGSVETSEEDRPAREGEKCAVTGRVLDPAKDRVIEIRLSGGSLGEGKSIRGVMDNGPMPAWMLGLPEAPNGQHRPTGLRVSHAAYIVMSTSTWYRWIDVPFREFIKECEECASGIIDDKELEKQRAVNAAKGTKRTVSLKKKTATMRRQWFHAYERCAFSERSVRKMIEVFFQFKQLQITHLAFASRLNKHHIEQQQAGEVDA